METLSLEDQTNALMLDTSTLFSLLVIVVFLVQVFSLSIATNNNQILGRSGTPKKMPVAQDLTELSAFVENAMIVKRSIDHLKNHKMDPDTNYDVRSGFSDEDFSAAIQDYYTRSPFGHQVEDSADSSHDQSSHFASYLPPPRQGHSPQGAIGYFQTFFSSARREMSNRPRRRADIRLSNEVRGYFSTDWSRFNNPLCGGNSREDLQDLRGKFKKETKEEAFGSSRSG